MCLTPCSIHVAIHKRYVISIVAFRDDDATCVLDRIIYLMCSYFVIVQSAETPLSLEQRSVVRAIVQAGKFIAFQISCLFISGASTYLRELAQLHFKVQTVHFRCGTATCTCTII